MICLAHTSGVMCIGIHRESSSTALTFDRLSSTRTTLWSAVHLASTRALSNASGEGFVLCKTSEQRKRALLGSKPMMSINSAHHAVGALLNTKVDSRSRREANACACAASEVFKSLRTTRMSMVFP